MKVTYDNNIEVGQYCGDHTGMELSIGNVDGGQAAITFHSSDDNTQTRGFLITFTAVEPCKLANNYEVA